MKAIVLTFDCLPVRLLGCYGNQSIVTPNFDRLAASAIVFDAHFGENFESTAHEHAWWTGRYQFPRVAIQRRNQPQLGQMLLQSGVRAQTLTENRKPAGHAFAAFGQLVDEARAKIKEFAESAAPQLIWLRAGGVDVENKSDVDGSQLASRMEELDSELGRLLGCVAAYSGADDVLFLLTASRGAPLGQGAIKNSPSIELNESVVQVPLIVRTTNGEMGSRRANLTQSVDIPSTLLEWFQIDATAHALEGHSLLSTIFDRATHERDHVCLGCGDRERAIRTREFYLIEQSSRDDMHAGAESDNDNRGSVFLFKKPDDRFEVHDVARQFPEACDELRSTLAGFVAGFALPEARA